MRRLIAADLLPERAGQQVKAVTSAACADRAWRCYWPDHRVGNTSGKWVSLAFRLGLEFFLLEFSFG